MANPRSPSRLQQIMEDRKLVMPRSVATLLMIAGAAGFVLSLVAFDGKVWCLFGSTVVVFAGLFFSMIARQRRLDIIEGGQDTDLQPADPVQIAQFNRGAPRQAPAPQSWTRLDRGSAAPESGNIQKVRSATIHQPGKPTTGPGSSPKQGRTMLSGQVSEVLRRQGAHVWIDAQKEDRSILKVQTPSGDIFTAVVLEGSQIVDVSEVRGLFGLMSATGSIGAFMVTGGTYTARAHDWARQRALTLLEAGQIADIRVD